jgi:chloramphenicol O-acetyltransferase type A
MKQQLDVDNWNRKEHFLFFKQFEEPFFGATVTIDCTKAYYTKKYRPRFYLLPSQNVRNGKSYRCFKYRIAEDNVYVYDQINASATIGRADALLVFLNRIQS